MSRDWNQRHVGLVGDWKVARHRRERTRVRLGGTSKVRIPICLGSGLVVSDNVVWPVEVTA